MKSKLATVRMHQRKYNDALKLYSEGREVFQELGDLRSVAAIWHAIGTVHEDAGQYEAAESAYQQSLNIEVRIGDGPGEASTLGQMGSLYSKMGHSEDAVRFHRQANETAASFGDLRSEAMGRSNLAYTLVKLQRYDEARVEIQRAIECKGPLGHGAESWKTYEILTELERAVGNEATVRASRNQAMQAYLAYRRAGGDSRAAGGNLCKLILHNPAEAARLILADLQRPDLPLEGRACVLALQAVLDGSRDTHAC